MYRLSPDKALVCTLDFFTPIVDDPYWFGQIAAANALADIYAMGGCPILALNIVCFPKEGLDKSILKEILRGGVEKVREAGAVLAGGHSLDDKEIKYGLSVVGLVHPKKFVTNAGARPGDLLLLSKPLGTGIIATAVKGGIVSEATQKRAIEIMATLNKPVSEAMNEIGVHAATDITGFGLLGHALEMALASNVQLLINASKVPIIKEAIEYVKLGFVPAGDFANKRFCERAVHIEAGVDPLLLEVLYDAQTSGGMLVSVPKDKAKAFFERLLEKGIFEAAFIGEVFKKTPHDPSVIVSF